MGKQIIVDSDRVVALSIAVRKYRDENKRGCPSGHVIHALGFSQKELDAAIDRNMVESVKGKAGGLFPFGEVPEKGDDTPSVTSRAFDMILAISRGETVNVDDARALWNEREALNATRRKE